MSENENLTNRQLQEKYAIDVNVDPYSIPLASLDPSHPSLFEFNKFSPYFDRLRAEDPLHYTEDSMYGPYWSATTYKDIMYIDSHHELFSSDIDQGGIRMGGRPTESPSADSPFYLPMFIMQDPPVHDDQRKVVAPSFTPKRIAELRHLIVERAGKILDNLPRNQEFNWVKEVSVELTGQMLATIFDVPQEDRSKLIYWSDTVENLSNPDFFETADEGFAELWKCFEYFDAVWKERAARSEPGSDLISSLVHGEATKNMTPNEFLGNMLLLIVGGNDTTRNSISGGVLALNQHPEQYAKLMASPELIPNMVPEIIRWQSPVAHMCRTATQDVEMHGKTIKKGDKVVMWYISGNRDTTMIDRADEFIIDRQHPRRHLSFGYGIHRCVGNRLGEMQLNVLWEEIVKRFPKIEVVGDPVYLKSHFIHGIRELPVKIPG
ncbi:MAG: cytochrome P450 [Pseudomonadales bacterium]|jgi:cytochrome P450|nr:cytochrome P450 [Pseudomonadales bacterium]